MLAPASSDSMKLPRLYLNGTHTNSGLCFEPISSVRRVMGGATSTSAPMISASGGSSHA